MSSDIEQRIAKLAGVGSEPRRICTALGQKNIGYLDLLETYNVTGNKIYHLWIRCGRNDDNLVHLLEAYRSGYGNPAFIMDLLAPACRVVIAHGKKLPKSSRLA